MICQKCKGTGQVGNFPLNLAIGVWPALELFKTICPKCLGKGEVEDER